MEGFTNWDAGLHWHLVSNLALSEGRLTQNQAPPRFLSVLSPLTPTKSIHRIFLSVTLDLWDYVQA